eukprot:s858_g21.t1
MEWFGQFDLLSHVSYPSLADLTADVVSAASAVSSQATTVLADVAPNTANWAQTQALVAAGAVVVGGAASYFSFETASAAAKTNDRMQAKELLKMVYRSASWRTTARAAYVPKPLDQTMPIETFLEQAKASRPHQLAVELRSKGCQTVEDLGPLLDRDPELWTKMRLHSGHEKKLVQSIKFSIDGSWPANSLVPAPVISKSRTDFPHKHKSSCYLLATSTIVLADRRSVRASQLQAPTRLQSFDVQRSHIANTKVERCSQESLGHLGHRMIRRLCLNSEALYRVTLLDQMMKQYTLIALEGQPLWGLTQEGYSWVYAGNCHKQDLSVGDKLLHYSKKLCVVVEIATWQPPNSTDHRLVHLSLQGIPTIFIDGFLASASV